MPLLHASSPAHVITTTNSGRTQDTGTTASFSPPADSWIFLDIGANQGATDAITFNLPTNTGTALSWALIGSTTNVSGGGCGSYRAYNANAQVGITVSVTIAYAPAVGGAAGNSGGMDVEVWTGCAQSQVGAAFTSSTSTAKTNNPSLTTTRAGSRVRLAGLDWTAGGNPTSSDTIKPYTVATQVSGGIAYKSADSGAPGAVTVNFVCAGASGTNSFLIYEILAPTSGQAPQMPTTIWSPFAKLGNKLPIGTPDAGATTVTLAPTEGQIIITGQTPALSLALGPSTGQVIIGGQTPTITLSLLPTTGSVVISGQTPAISRILVPTEGQVIITGQVPTLTKVLVPSEGQVIIGGQTPTVTQAVILNPSEGQIVISGQTPAMSRILVPSTGQIIIGGQIPVVSVITPTTGRSKFWRERQSIDWNVPFSFADQIKPEIQVIEQQVKEQKVYKQKLYEYKTDTADFTSIEKEIAHVEAKIKALLEQKDEYYTEYFEFIKQYKADKAHQRELKKAYLVTFKANEEARIEEIEFMELLDLGVI